MSWSPRLIRPDELPAVVDLLALGFGEGPVAPPEIRAAVDEVITANPDEWARYVDGDDRVRGKLTGFFVGQVMKATRGQADGKAVTAMLRERAGA
ncbi:MAG TPA: GatB/YqeY domain-containing protein, partial [Acidimicrobiales bacterium]